MARFPGPWSVGTVSAQRDNTLIAHAVSNLEACLTIADTQWSIAEYLENPNFTLANMLLGHILYRYRNINFSREAFPSLRRHYEASTSMPAFRRHINIR